LQIFPFIRSTCMITIAGLLLTACGTTTGGVTPTADRFAAQTPAQGDSAPNSGGSVPGSGSGLVDPNRGTVAPISAATTASTMISTTAALAVTSVGTVASAGAGGTMAATSASACPQAATAAADAATVIGNQSPVPVMTSGATAVVGGSPTRIADAPIATSALATAAATVQGSAPTVVAQREKAFLGVTGETIPNCGVSITQIRPGSAAQVGNLQAGDIILAVDKQPVATMEQLQAIIDKHTVSDHISVTYRRNGKTSDTTFELMAQPASTVPTQGGAVLPTQASP